MLPNCDICVELLLAALQAHNSAPQPNPCKEGSAMFVKDQAPVTVAVVPDGKLADDTKQAQPEVRFRPVPRQACCCWARRSQRKKTYEATPMGLWAIPTAAMARVAVP
eukprot:363378-Chlamydomonas_euryale.AAC.36